MKVLLTLTAERLLRELPHPAAARVVSALRALQAAPTSGRRYPDDSPFAGCYYKTIVVRSRRWSYRVTYELHGDVLWVLYLFPSWYPMTHPDLSRIPSGDD